MNIEHYHNFITIVEAGTISAASRVLLIAQPALSNQIKAFEKEYGAKLLKRGARKIELTNAGQILYEKAKNICSLEELVKSEIKDCISGSRGTLHIGITPAYPDHFLFDLLLDFSEEYPEIKFDLFETSSDQILELLKNHIIEIGIIRTPTYINPIFRSYKTIVEHLMVVFHKDNPWFTKDMKSIYVSSLKNIPISISKGFKQKIIDICLEAGFMPNLRSVCSSRVIALMWATRGTTVSIVASAHQTEQETDNLICRPLIGGDTSTKRSFTILNGQKLSSVAQTFLNFALKKDF